MSNIIRLRRSSSVASPATLDEGVPAYSFNSDRLFIGNTSNLPVVIGGRYFTAKLEHTPGVLTANAAVITDANNSVQDFRAASLRIGPSGGTQYQITSIANTISAGSTNNALVTAKAVYDYVSALGASSDLNGLTDVTIAAIANGQMLIYDNTDGQWKNRTLTGQVTINAIGNTTITAGSISNNEISDSAGINRGKLGLGSANHVVINNGTGALSSEAQLAIARGGTGIGTVPNNGQLLIGNGSAYSLGTIAGTANQITVTNGSGTISLSLPSTLVVPGSLVVTTTLNVTGAATFSNTVNVAGLSTLGNITAATANVNVLHVDGNATINGNLVVNGTLTTIDVEEIAVSDPMIFLARNNNASDLVDIGLFGMYDPDGTNRYTGFFRDATDGKWKLFANTSVAPTSTVDTSAASYRVATLVANFESANVQFTGGTITGITDLAVADGGTGVSAFPVNSVLFGATSTSLGFANGTLGQVMQINGSGVPFFGHLDGGNF